MKDTILKDNTSEPFENISSKLAEMSIEIVKNYEKEHIDAPPEHIRVRRALGETLRSYVHFEQRDVVIEQPFRMEDKRLEQIEADYKKKAAMDMLSELYDKGLIEIREIDQFKNLGLPRKTFRLTLPVFNWRKL